MDINLIHINNNFINTLFDKKIFLFEHFLNIIIWQN